MKKLVLIVLLAFPVLGFAQKKQLVEYREQIVEKAVAELDSVCKAPDGILYRRAMESAVKGEFVFNITLREKGEIATVFVVNDGVNPIPVQNRLKDLVKRYRFSFKVPKGKSYKFQYTFSF